MKIAVIGAGVVGVTTAYELATEGHEVIVFERCSAVAEETSFANAGIIAPGYVAPWSAPGMPAKVLRDLLSRHASVRLSLPLTGNDVTWMWRWLKSCHVDVWRANRERMHRLAFYSRERLDFLAENLALEFDASQGYLVLLRTAKDHQRAATGLALLRDAGVAALEVSAEQARVLEPALNIDTPLQGGIHMPQDGVANCRQFALLLKRHAQQLGVQFEFNTRVVRLNASRPGNIQTVPTTSAQPQLPQTHQFDASVVCAGAFSAALLQPLGLNLPMTAVYGYSISATIGEPLNAPRSAVMDERYKVAISRLGNRVRVAGSAELGGSPAIKNPASLQTLYKVLQDWFPGAARLASTSNGGSIGAGIQEWKGARPMMPDGPPLIGSSGIPGVWLNVGHGSSGWALSCGSARMLTDLMSGKVPDINPDGLGIDRLHRSRWL
ncbi:MAG: D-amino acid dehydrogenase [Polaromonas sp.]